MICGIFDRRGHHRACCMPLLGAVDEGRAAERACASALSPPSCVDARAGPALWGGACMWSGAWICVPGWHGVCTTHMRQSVSSLYRMTQFWCARTLKRAVCGEQVRARQHLRARELQGLLRVSGAFFAQDCSGQASLCEEAGFLWERLAVPVLPNVRQLVALAHSCSELPVSMHTRCKCMRCMLGCSLSAVTGIIQCTMQGSQRSGMHSSCGFYNQ